MDNQTKEMLRVLIKKTRAELQVSEENDLCDRLRELEESLQTDSVDVARLEAVRNAISANLFWRERKREMETTPDGLDPFSNELDATLELLYLLNKTVTAQTITTPAREAQR